MNNRPFGRSRRDFMRLAILAGASASLPLAPSAHSQVPQNGPGAPGQQPGALSTSTGTKLILLGTKGGPTISSFRAQPANALLIDGRPYVVDCGNGVAIQLSKAGIKLPSVGNIFITHHHSDHNADLGNLIFLAWVSGLRTPVHVYGPPGTTKLIDKFVEMNEIDIAGRINEEGRPALRPLIKVHEFDGPGTVMEDDRVRVTATLVDHYAFKPAFGYRFDSKDRSVVFSGDTTYCPALADLAKGADVLVHEVMYEPGVHAIVKNFGENAPTLLDHLIKSHATSAQVGKIAAKAGVKTLVLTHFVPGADPTITDEMWTEGARREFGGQIIVGRDLQVI